MIAKVPKGALFEHFKGKKYKILGVARHSETLKMCVVYQALYDSPQFGDHAVWVRPLVLCQQSFYSFGYVKAPGLNDRKASCIELIQRALRSFNRGSFHVSPNCKNFADRAPEMFLETVIIEGKEIPRFRLLSEEM